MTCFRRAIRAHRRLNKLAPHEFDAAVVDRDRREREERRAWMATWQPALEKVYGPPTPEERERERREEFEAAQPPRLHPRIRQAVGREYAAWQFWMEAGRQAGSRHRQRRPHAVPSLGCVARLLEIGMDFGALATGLDWRRSAPPSSSQSPPPDFEADLRRAYGGQSNPPSEVSSGTAPPVAGPNTAESVSTQRLGNASAAATGVTHHGPGQNPKPAPPPPQRRDAWQTWARHQRQGRVA